MNDFDLSNFAPSCILGDPCCLGLWFCWLSRLCKSVRMGKGVDSPNQCQQNVAANHTTQDTTMSDFNFFWPSRKYNFRYSPHAGILYLPCSRSPSPRDDRSTLCKGTYPPPELGNRPLPDLVIWPADERGLIFRGSCKIARLRPPSGLCHLSTSLSVSVSVVQESFFTPSSSSSSSHLLRSGRRRVYHSRIRLPIMRLGLIDLKQVKLGSLILSQLNQDG